jgi:hypothetical protein
MSTVLTTALAPTEAIANTEPAVDIASIKELMDGFDPAALLPELDQVFSTAATVCRVAVLVGPVLLLALGLAYLFLSPKEANYYFGYRCYYGMGSVQAWRFTQRLAGIVLGGLGLVLTGVMLVVSGGFGGMDTMDMAWRALGCVFWEAVLTVAAVLAINGTAALTFDFRGEYRNRRKRQ